MKKENIIFSNLYGKHDESIKGAVKRGDWKNINKILKKREKYVITGGVPVGVPGTTNYLSVLKIV